MELNELASPRRQAAMVGLAVQAYLDDLTNLCAELERGGDHETARTIAERGDEVIQVAADVYEKITGTPLMLSRALAGHLDTRR